MREPGSATNDCIEFLGIADNSYVESELYAIALTLDTEGITWELLLGTFIEFLNWNGFMAYFVFWLSMPKITDYFDNFD